MIPYGRQSISEEDIEAVVEVLRSDYLTQGSSVPAFETAVADYSGASHAIATNSATSALHIACLALGLGKTDWLWTSAVTFVASANCGRYCGANIDFVDIDPTTYNLSVDALTRKLELAEEQNRLPKIVVVVHLAGQACDMREISALAKQYGFRVIEDASHAIGGKYNGQPIGNSEHSDITVFSFHPVKIVTSAEGGMLTTNCPELADKLRLLRTHYITRDSEQMIHPREDDWYYEQIGLGFNYRLSDVHAALGLSQLKRVDEFVSQRHDLAQRYNQLLEDKPLTLPYQADCVYSTFHLYIVRLQLDKISATHSEVFSHLRGSGIGVNLHYIPLYQQPYYQNLGIDYGPFPNSDQYYKEAISLPLYPGLPMESQDTVIEALQKALR